VLLADPTAAHGAQLLRFQFPARCKVDFVAGHHCAPVVIAKFQRSHRAACGFIGHYLHRRSPVALPSLATPLSGENAGLGSVTWGTDSRGLVAAIQISCSARLAFDCWLFGSLFKTLAVLCTQQRCPRVFGHTCSTACQKPSAPSATASCGPITSPRRFRSRSSSLQDCALSRTPDRPARPL
jgi:hypothetical protein